MLNAVVVYFYAAVVFISHTIHPPEEIYVCRSSGHSGESVYYLFCSLFFSLFRSRWIICWNSYKTAFKRRVAQQQHTYSYIHAFGEIKTICPVYKNLSPWTTYEVIHFHTYTYTYTCIHTYTYKQNIKKKQNKNNVMLTHIYLTTFGWFRIYKFLLQLTMYL